MAALAKALLILAVFVFATVCAAHENPEGGAFRKGVDGFHLRRKLLQEPVPGGRIVGENAPCGRYPYMVSLRNTNNAHKCGGVLIHPRWILTAAHCVDPRSETSLGVEPIIAIGVCELEDEDEDIEITLPEETFIHPNWTGAFEDGADIALLKLKRKSKFTPATLPLKGAQLADGQLLVAIGWGELPNGAPPNRLQQSTEVSFFPERFCRGEDVWGSIIKDSMFCAIGFGNAEVTCGGDSGGPILRAFAPRGDIARGNPELDTVVGITSFGEKGAPCGKATKPGVYTRVHSFLDWIDDPQAAPQAGSEATNEGSSAPSTSSNLGPEGESGGEDESTSDNKTMEDCSNLPTIADKIQCFDRKEGEAPAPEASPGPATDLSLSLVAAPASAETRMVETMTEQIAPTSEDCPSEGSALLECLTKKASALENEPETAVESKSASDSPIEEASIPEGSPTQKTIQDCLKLKSNTRQIACIREIERG